MGELDQRLEDQLGKVPQNSPGEKRWVGEKRICEKESWSSKVL